MVHFIIAFRGKKLRGYRLNGVRFKKLRDLPAERNLIIGRWKQ